MLGVSTNFTRYTERVTKERDHWSLVIGVRALLLRKIGCSVTQNEAYRIRVDDDDKKRMIFDVNLPHKD